MQLKDPMGPWAHAEPRVPAYKLGAWCRSSPAGGIHFQKWVLDFGGMYPPFQASETLKCYLPWAYPPLSNHLEAT